MAIISSHTLKYFSILILIFGILYKYEIPSDQSTSDRKTFLITKKALLEFNRSHIYKIITNIDQYKAWYPNVDRVEHVQTKNHKDAQYRLITIVPLIGDVPSSLIIHMKNRPKRFMYSVNSWLDEINLIELKDNLKNVNLTNIEWTVYTKRRSLFFQYLLLPFAKFYKDQIVREALFSLKTRIRDL